MNESLIEILNANTYIYIYIYIYVYVWEYKPIKIVKKVILLHNNK